MARRKTKTTTTSTTTGKAKVNLSLTRQATDTLTAIAKETGLSRSALFENILSGSISIDNKKAEKTVRT